MSTKLPLTVLVMELSESLRLGNCCLLLGWGETKTNLRTTCPTWNLTVLTWVCVACVCVGSGLNKEGMCFWISWCKRVSWGNAKKKIRNHTGGTKTKKKNAESRIGSLGVLGGSDVHLRGYSIRLPSETKWLSLALVLGVNPTHTAHTIIMRRPKKTVRFQLWWFFNCRDSVVCMCTVYL